MRISELSRASGVPVPTLKFYLREGLLPPGTRTARNQADYNDDHLRRVRLIRALTDVGGLSLASVRAVLQALEDESLPTHQLLGVAHRALGPVPDSEEPPEDVREARRDVDRFISDLGWQVQSDAPSRRSLADALVMLRRMGWNADPEIFRRYADAADMLAEREVGSVQGAASRSEAVERAVTGTVAFEAALVALRRLAQEHHSARRFSSDAA